MGVGPFILDGCIDLPAMEFGGIAGSIPGLQDFVDNLVENTLGEIADTKWIDCYETCRTEARNQIETIPREKDTDETFYGLPYVNWEDKSCPVKFSLENVTNYDHEWNEDDWHAEDDVDCPLTVPTKWNPMPGGDMVDFMCSSGGDAGDDAETTCTAWKDYLIKEEHCPYPPFWRKAVEKPDDPKVKEVKKKIDDIVNQGTYDLDWDDPKDVDLSSVNGIVEKIDGTVEKIDGVMEAIGEKIDGVFEKVDGTVEGIEGTMEKGTEKIDGTFETVNGRLDGAEGKLEGISADVDKVGKVTGTVKYVGIVGTVVLNDEKPANAVEWIDGKVEFIEGTVTNANAKVDKVQGSVGKFQGKVDNLKGRANKVTGKVDKFTGKVEGKIEAKVDKVTGKVDKFQGKVDSLNGKVDKVTGAVDKFQGTVDKIEAQVGKVTGTVDKFKGTVDKIEGKIDSVIGTIKGITAAVQKGLEGFGILGTPTYDLASEYEKVANSITTEEKCVLKNDTIARTRFMSPCLSSFVGGETGGMVDLLFGVDTSGSMDGEWGDLCGIIDDVANRIRTECGIDLRTKIYAFGGEPPALPVKKGTCSVTGWDCWDDNNCDIGDPGDTCVGAVSETPDCYDEVLSELDSEDWGPWVEFWSKEGKAEWRPGAGRFMIPIADECPYHGNNKCHWYSLDEKCCNDNDKTSRDLAIDAANANGVTVYGFMGDGMVAPAKDHMRILSEKTGGQAFYWKDAETAAAIISSLFCEPAQFRLVNVSHNIKEFVHPKFTLIETANMPFNISYYELRVGPVSLPNDETVFMYEFVRIIDPIDADRRFVLDSDLVVDCGVSDDDYNMWLNVSHEYVTGTRREIYYEACHEKMCQEPECDCVLDGKFCKATHSKTPKVTDIPRCCGGISHEEKPDCMCCYRPPVPTPFGEIPPDCKDPSHQNQGDYYKSDRYRLEVESEYKTSVIRTGDFMNITKVLHKDSAKDTTMRIDGVVGTEEFMGDSVVRGYTNVTFAEPFIVTGFGIELNDSVIVYNPLYLPAKHELWRKKSSPGPLALQYNLTDYYGYLREDFRVHPQCKLLCPTYCKCPADDKLKPVCFNMKSAEEIFTADLCNEYWAELGYTSMESCLEKFEDDLSAIEEMCSGHWAEFGYSSVDSCIARLEDDIVSNEAAIEEICDTSWLELGYDGVDSCIAQLESDIKGQAFIEETCSAYLERIGFYRCVETRSRLGCANEHRGDELFEACLYIHNMEIRYDCVCPITHADDPCITTREFHEEEGSRIVNGDFEMGRLGPWKELPDSIKGLLPGGLTSSPEVIWNGAQGYNLMMRGGSAIYQAINPTHGDPNRMLCFDYSINETRAGLLVLLLDYEGDIAVEDMIVYPCVPNVPYIDLPFEGIPGYCIEGWQQKCMEIPYNRNLSGIAIAAFSPSTITDIAEEIGFDPSVFPIDMKMLGLEGDQTFLIDNINLGKYHDFVHHYTQPIRKSSPGLGRIADYSPTDTTAFGLLSVVYANITENPPAPPEEFDCSSLGIVEPKIGQYKEGPLGDANTFLKFFIKNNDGDEVNIKVDTCMTCWRKHDNCDEDTHDGPKESYSIPPGEREFYEFKNFCDQKDDQKDKGQWNRFDVKIGVEGKTCDKCIECLHTDDEKPCENVLDTECSLTPQGADVECNRGWCGDMSVPTPPPKEEGYGITTLTMEYSGISSKYLDIGTGETEESAITMSEFTDADIVIFTPASDTEKKLFPQTDTCTPKCMADYESCKLHDKTYDAYCRTTCQGDEEWAGGTGDDWCAYRFGAGHQCCCCKPPP